MSERTCKKGHTFHKSSDCPTCPICAREEKRSDGFWADLSAPAQRALQSIGIEQLDGLAKYSEKDLLALHGFGKASLPKLRARLQEAGLHFKEKK